MRLLEHKPQEHCKQTFFYPTGVAVVFEYANLIGCRSSEKPDPVILLDWFRIRIRGKKNSGSSSLGQNNVFQLIMRPDLARRMLLYQSHSPNVSDAFNIFTMFLRFKFLQDNINCLKCDGVRLWVALNIAPNFLQLQSSVWWGFKTPKKPRSIIAPAPDVFAPDYLLWGEFRQVPTPICSLYAGIYSTCFKSVQYQVLSSQFMTEILIIKPVKSKYWDSS